MLTLVTLLACWRTIISAFKYHYVGTPVSSESGLSHGVGVSTIIRSEVSPNAHLCPVREPLLGVLRVMLC